jgi:hypothetical protein
MDINDDGCKDFVVILDFAFINDCTGNFSATQYRDTQFILNGYQFATGACAGDFTGSGHSQIVLADRMVPDGIRAVNTIVDFDKNLNAISNAPLPIPYLAILYPNLANSDPRPAHSYKCDVADVDNDGKLDIVIYTTNWFLKSAPYNYVPQKFYSDLQKYKCKRCLVNPRH